MRARGSERNRDAWIRRAAWLLAGLVVIVALAVVTLVMTGMSVPNEAYWFAMALTLVHWLLMCLLPARPWHDHDRQ